jgi:hypothetical protein
LLRKGVLWGALFLALAAPALAEDRTVAERQLETIGLHAYGGVAIFSLRDGKQYRLVASTNGGPPQALPVPAQTRPFDADIGRGKDGRPTVVWRAGTKLRVLAIGGAKSHSVAGIRVPNKNVHPTLSGSTVVWFADKAIRTKGRTIAPLDVAQVLELDLSGRQLAVNVVTTFDDGVCGRRELQLMDTRSGKAKVLGSQGCGLNGQTFNGPTFDGGWLYFSRSCNLDCGTARYGAYRYRGNRWEISGDGRPVQGWAWGGKASAYQLRAQSDVGCTDPDVACTLVWQDGLPPFKQVGAPIH